MDSKICTKCNENKLLSEFCKKLKGKASQCRSCKSIAHKAWYVDNKEGQVVKRRIYREENKDVIAAKNKILYDENRESVLSQKKEYYKENRTEIRAKRKLSYEENKEEVKATSKAYREANKDKIRAVRKAYVKNKIENDHLFYFTRLVSSRVRSAIKIRGFTKKSKTAQILCCSCEELYSHLVLSAMDNYGLYLDVLDYEIDHIIPMATAKTEEDVIRLNHYTNLQFLYPGDNGAKSDSLTWMDEFRHKRDLLRTAPP